MGPNEDAMGPNPSIDGDTLVCHDGTRHTITLIEKLLLRCGLTSIYVLNRKYNSEPRKG